MTLASERAPETEPRPGVGLLVDGGVILGLCLFTVVAQNLRGISVASSDLLTMFLPNFSWWWLEWRLPGGWNPWLFAGYPAGSDPLVGVVHPLGVLYAVFPPLTAGAAEQVLAPAAGGIGMMVYVRSIGGGRLGGMIAGIVYAFGGWSSGHVVHPEKLRSTLAAPWALAAIETLDTRRRIVGLGIALAVVVAGGHPHTVLLLLVVIAAYGLAFGGRGMTDRIVGLAGAGLLGALLSAPGWLPALQFISESTRSLGIEAGAGSPRVAPVDLWGLLTPVNTQGRLGFGSCSPVECSVYAGAVVWVVIACRFSTIVRSSHGLFWLGVAIVGITLSMGPLDQLFLAWGIRGPSRFLFWFHLATASLVGVALARRTPALLPVALAGVVALMVAGTRPDLAWSASYAGSFLLALAIGLSAAPRWPRAAHWAVVVVFTIDLLIFRALQPMAGTDDRIGATRAQLRELRETLRARPGPDAGLGRVVRVPMAFLPNWAASEQVPLVQGYNTLVWRRLIALLHSEGEHPLPEQALVTDANLGSDRNQALDLLRARVVLLRPNARDPLSRAIRDSDGSRWIRHQNTGATELFENRRALPVAWAVSEVVVESDEDALDRIHGRAGALPFDPRHTALVDPHLLSAQTSALIDRGPIATEQSVEVVSYEDDRLSLRVSASDDVLLVTSELAYPGWEASVDGERAELVRVNTAFRGVVVPAGSHRVAFVYRPLPGRIGLALALGGLVLSVLLAAPRSLSWRRGKIASPLRSAASTTAKPSPARKPGGRYARVTVEVPLGTSTPRTRP